MPRRPDSERLRADGKKNATSGGKTGVPGNVFWDLQDGTNRLHAAHESFSGPAMLTEVPLAGLSFCPIPRKPRSGRHDRKPIELRAQQTAEIDAVECRQDVGRRQSTEQDWPVFVHRKHGRLVDRQHIIDQDEPLSRPQR